MFVWAVPMRCGYNLGTCCATAPFEGKRHTYILVHIQYSACIYKEKRELTLHI